MMPIVGDDEYRWHPYRPLTMTHGLRHSQKGFIDLDVFSVVEIFECFDMPLYRREVVAFCWPRECIDRCRFCDGISRMR